MYVSIQEVRNSLGVSDKDIVSDAVIQQAIEFAEDEIDRLTYTTYYPVEEKGTATAFSATTLEDDTCTWTVNQFQDYAVYIYNGTGKGQIREIVSNTADTLTVTTWTTTPDATSRYIITYLNKQTLELDGSGTSQMLIPDYPIVQVDELKIEDTAVSSDKYVVYHSVGKIILKDTAEKNRFTAPDGSLYRKNVEITYHWGRLPDFKRGSVEIDRVIKRATCIIATLQALTYQMGGTYDTLSTFSTVNLSGSIGQAYINIKGVVDTLTKELEDYKKQYLGKYVYMV